SSGCGTARSSESIAAPLLSTHKAWSNRNRRTPCLPRHGIDWRCIDANSPMRRPAAVYSGSIIGFWPSRNNFRTSQPRKSEETLAGQSVSTGNCHLTTASTVRKEYSHVSDIPFFRIPLHGAFVKYSLATVRRRNCLYSYLSCNEIRKRFRCIV